MKIHAVLASLLLCAPVMAIAQTESASEVLAANAAASGDAAWARHKGLQAIYSYAGHGLNGKIRTIFDVRTGAYVDTYDIDPAPEAYGFDGSELWHKDISGAVTPEGADADRRVATSEAYRNANLWWRPDRAAACIISLGLKTESGKTYEVLSVKPKGGNPFNAWFDPVTHLIARTVEARAFWTVTTSFSNYRRIKGALIAGKIIADDGSGEKNSETKSLTSASFVALDGSTFSPPETHLTDASIKNGSGRTTVPFELLNNHIYTDVMVDNTGPFRFIVDTGGFAVLTPGMAKSLSAKVQGNADLRGVGSGVVDQGFARNISFRVGDLVMQNKVLQVAPIIDPTVEGFSPAGMIGFELFRRVVTEIDYGQKTVTFIEPARFDATHAGIAIPFTFNEQKPQVAGSFEGIAGKFNIDTGSRLELSLTSPFVKEHSLISKNPNGITVVDGWGVGGPSRSYVVRADDLMLGTVKIDDSIVGLSTESKGGFSNPDFSGNVGSALLKRFVVTFDYPNRIMYLRPLPHPVKDSGVFDRAGLWINTGMGAFKVVDVTPHGAAQVAGLVVGDEIVEVNGVPAKSISISDLRARWRDEPINTKFNMKVENSGKSRSVTITSRDEIRDQVAYSRKPSVRAG